MLWPNRCGIILDLLSAIVQRVAPRQSFGAVKDYEISSGGTNKNDALLRTEQFSLVK